MLTFNNAIEYKGHSALKMLGRVDFAPGIVVKNKYLDVVLRRRGDQAGFIVEARLPPQQISGHRTQRRQRRMRKARYADQFAVNRAERPDAPPTHYSNGRVPGAVTAVAGATFAASRPVACSRATNATVSPSIVA